jgi:hypothetical protein
LRHRGVLWNDREPGMRRVLDPDLTVLVDEPVVDPALRLDRNAVAGIGKLKLLVDADDHAAPKRR